MRVLILTTVAALMATSACSSSGGGSSAMASPRSTSSGPASTAAPTRQANIPGFSGPVPRSSGSITHVFGQCLRSWYAKAGSGTRVHVEYPGPATVSVDLTIMDQSEPPPDAHRSITIPAGGRTKEITFPAVPHAGYPQITVTAGGRTVTCDAAER